MARLVLKVHGSNNYFIRISANADGDPNLQNIVIILLHIKTETDCANLIRNNMLINCPFYLKYCFQYMET